MSVDIRRIRGVAILDLSGEWLDDPEFRLVHEVRQLLASGEKRILVNLTNVSSTFGDHGMGNLIRSYLACQQEGGDLKLVDARKEILRTLEEARMTSVLAVYPDEHEALAAFN